MDPAASSLGAHQRHRERVERAAAAPLVRPRLAEPACAKSAQRLLAAPPTGNFVSAKRARERARERGQGPHGPRAVAVSSAEAGRANLAAPRLRHPPGSVREWKRLAGEDAAARYRAAAESAESAEAPFNRRSNRGAKRRYLRSGGRCGDQEGAVCGGGAADAEAGVRRQRRARDPLHKNERRSREAEREGGGAART